jgi:hypothetical protein
MARNPEGEAIASGTIVTKLIESLTAKGVLTRDEARGILIESKNKLAPEQHTHSVGHAIKHIERLLKEFPG